MQGATVFRLLKRATMFVPLVLLCLLPASASGISPVYSCTSLQYEVATDTDLVVAPGCSGGSGAAIAYSNPVSGSPDATLTVNVDGDLVFRASAPASFLVTYTASDGTTSEQQQLAITVPGTLVCQRTAAAVTPLGVGTLLPCSGGGPQLTAHIASQPSHGTATLSGMTLSYLPALRFSGHDHVVYEVTDANGHVTSTDIVYTATVLPPAGDICAVDNGVVSQEAYDTMIDQAKAGYRSSHEDFPTVGTREYADLRDNAVNYLVEQELYRQHAAQLGVVVTDAEVTKRLNELIRSFFGGDLNKYLAELKKQHVTEAQVRANLYQQLLTEELYNVVTKNVSVTRAQARRYYRSHRDEFRTPRTRGVRHILVKTRAEAWTVHWLVSRHPSRTFARAARKYSLDPSSAAQGGVLVIAQGETVPEFDRAAFALATGAMSVPVKTQFGWHIIWATTHIRRPRSIPFRGVASSIRQSLAQEKKTRVMQSWRDTMRKQAFVTCISPYRWIQNVKVSGPPRMSNAKLFLGASPASSADRVSRAT